MGEISTNWQKVSEITKRRKPIYVPLKDQESLYVGDLVQIGSSEFIGHVQYIGIPEFADGEWIGVQCRKPCGKNDGSVKGVRYFSCPPKHGLFTRRSSLVRVEATFGPGNENLNSEPSNASTTDTGNQTKSESSPTAQGAARRPSRSKKAEIDAGKQSAVREMLAVAVENHDFQSLRNILPKACELRIDTAEVTNGFKIWNYEFDRLKKSQEESQLDVEEVRKALELLDEDVSLQGADAKDMSVSERLRISLALMQAELSSKREAAGPTVESMVNDLKQMAASVQAEQESVKAMQKQLAEMYSILVQDGRHAENGGKAPFSQDLQAAIQETVRASLQPVMAELNSIRGDIAASGFKERAGNVMPPSGQKEGPAKKAMAKSPPSPTSPKMRPKKLNQQNTVNIAALTASAATAKPEGSNALLPPGKAQVRRSLFAPPPNRATGGERSSLANPSAAQESVLEVTKLSEIEWTKTVAVPERYTTAQITREAETHRRAIKLEQLADLCALVKEVLKAVFVLDPRPDLDGRNKRITYDSVNLYHMCELFVMPLTRPQESSFVELVMDGPQDPVWFMSHWWGTHFKDSLDMLQWHAKCHGMDNSTTYWVCTFANNQHNLEELAEDDILKTPFVKAIVTQSCRGTVMTMNEKQGIVDAAEPFRRTWCTLENFISTTLAREQKPDYKLEVAAIVPARHETVTDEDGNRVKVPRCPALLYQSAQDTWEDKVDFPGAWFPTQVACNGVQVDIATASASNLDDKKNILRLIIGEKDPAKMPEPPDHHAAYDKVNREIHRVFAPRALFGYSQVSPGEREYQQKVEEVSKIIGSNLVDLHGSAFKNSAGETPFWTAATHGCAEVVKLFLDQDIDPNGHCGSGGTTALLAAAAENHLEVVKLLISRRADIHLTNEAGTSALLAAVADDLEDMVQELISQRADVNLADNEGITPVFMTAQDNTSAVLEQLLAARANVDGSTKNDAPPVLVAALNGSEDVLFMLLEAKADPNAGSITGDVPLLLAASNEHAGVVEILLQGKADPNITDQEGATALSWAAYQADEETTSNLIKYGADVNAVSGGESALDNAMSRMDDASAAPEIRERAKATVEVLLQAGALSATELQ